MYKTSRNDVLLYVGYIRDVLSSKNILWMSRCSNNQDVLSIQIILRFKTSGKYNIGPSSVESGKSGSECVVGFYYLSKI